MKKLLSIILCFVLLLSLIACGGNDKPAAVNAQDGLAATSESSGTNNAPEAEEKIRDTIKIGVANNPPGFDPQNYAEASSMTMPNILIWETLVTMNFDTGAYDPCLAESWEQPVPTEYVFHLRQGVKFHDGSDFDADDVLYTYNRGKDLAVSAGHMANIEKVEKIDKYTVKITLKAASPVFFVDLSNINFSIIPDGSDDSLANNPNGTGPYKLKDQVADSSVTFERFDEYWGGIENHPSKFIRFIVMPDVSARIMALEAGDVDVAYQTQASDVDTINANPDLLSVARTSTRMFTMFFNVTEAPFDDPHVRAAIAYAIDRQNIIDGAYSGYPVKIFNFVLDTDFGAAQDAIKRDYDLEAAKAELAKSAYPDGFTFTVHTTKSQVLASQIIQYSLSQIGITMEIDPISSVFDYGRRGYEGALFTVYGNNTGDAGPILSQYIRTGATNNVMGYSNAEADALIDAASVETDTAKRAEMLQKANAMAIEDQAILPLYSDNVYVGIWKNRVKGIVMNPAGPHNYSTWYVVD